MNKSQNGIFPEPIKDELSGPPQEPLAMSDTTNPMKRFRSLLPGTRIGIIGGKRLCRSFLEIIFRLSPDSIRPEIVGVADLDSNGEGILFAKEKNIFIAKNPLDLLMIKGMDLLLDLRGDDSAFKAVEEILPSGLKLLDRLEAQLILDLLRIEEKRLQIQHWRGLENRDPEAIAGMFGEFLDAVSTAARERHVESRRVWHALRAGEKAMGQIVEASTVPTFVINKDHVVTQWNRACEKLTGYLAKRMVGTSDHWKPFRSTKRHIMADLIVEEIREEDVFKYYGTLWRKSALIEGAYETEGYFHHLGDEGKWLFFTAAPIRGSDGSIVGAIEALWDKTEERRAQRQLERYTKELALRTEKLLESERVMTQIIQGSTIPTFVINRDHRVIHWNHAMGKLSGFPAEVMIGTNRQWEPFWEQERPSMADVILNQISEEEIRKLYGTQWRKSALIQDAYEAEAFFPKLGNGGKWCYFTAAPIKAPDGTIIGAIETLWDKTEDKKAEEDHKRHNRQLAALAAISTALGSSLKLEEGLKEAVTEIFNYLAVDSFCIFLKETDGRFVLKYFYGKEAVFFGKENGQDLSELLYQAIKHSHVVIYENIIFEKYQGMQRYLNAGIQSLALIPLIDKNGQVFGVIQIGSKASQNFTAEQKNILSLIGNRIGVALENYQLYEQYRKSEEKYRFLFNNDPNPIFILDSDNFEILDLNDRARDCYGYKRDEILGMSFLDVGEKDDEEIVKGLRTISNSRSVLFSKKRHFRKGGAPFFVNIHVSRSDYNEKDVLIASTADISESMEKEAQLIQASKMTTLGLMAAGMAHEINQPLNVLQVCADTLLKSFNKGVSLKAEDLRSMADDISQNVQRAAGIIKHMRDFSRMSEGVQSRVDINDPIRDVFKVLGHQLKMHRVELVLDLTCHLPDILAESNRLEQVFINLVTNAVDAMDEQERRVSPATIQKKLCIRSYTENDTVIATVSDSGTGMTREVMDKIFEPFFTTKEVGKGTGLGVSISYGIVKDYNGTISVRSEVGKGTTFELRFPVAS